MFNYVVEGKALIRAIPGLSTRTAQSAGYCLCRLRRSGTSGTLARRR
jgi:hypothetical protein